MMTKDERMMSKDTRNAAICARYQAGAKLAEVAKHFQLGRQRVLQILKAADVWRPYEKGTRTKFLGVTVSEETKLGLLRLAEERGTSVSKLTSDALDGMVAGVEE